MSPAQQFLDWLKENDPFMYDVVKMKVTYSRQSVDGLGFWASVGTALSNVGSAIASAAPAYLSYKQGKDLSKLEKAKLSLAKKQTDAQIAAEKKAQDIAMKEASAKQAAAVNTSAIDEILKRLNLAQNGQSQPPTSGYTPFVNPSNMTPAQYQAAVVATANVPWYSRPEIAIPLAMGLLGILILKRRNRRR